MPMEAMRRSVEARWQRDVYFSRLYGLDTVEDFEHIEQRSLEKSNPYYTIQLFYDFERFRTAAGKRQLRQHLAAAQARYPGRNIELRPISTASLTYRSMSLFPGVEKRFIERGYVLDVEERAKKTDRRGNFLVVGHNIDVLRANAHHWGRMLLAAGTSLRLWAHRPPEKQRDRLFEAMEPITGRSSRPDKNRTRAEKTIPLVEHEQMLLGARSVEGRVVHIAYQTTPGTVADQGRREYQTLFSDRADLVEQQMIDELGNAHRIFEGVDAPSAEANSTTKAAILTWFSQVVATQRKVCWLLAAKRNWSLALDQLRVEKELYTEITGVRTLPLRMNDAKSWPELLESELKGHADDIQGSIKQRPESKNRRYDVTLQSFILAALHGSTIDLGDDNEQEFFDTGSHLIALAHWIGVLKRTGQQTFGKHIAQCLRIGWSEIEAGQNVLLGQLPMEVWRLLLQRSKEFFPRLIVAPGKLPRLNHEGFKEPRPIKVKYEWITPETLDTSLCRSTSGSITVRGPMLCFPLHQIEDWKAKGDIIRRQRGFTI